jgi:putative ABC transport system permease protein
VETLTRDARFALRLLRRSPGFTAIALVALALSIGSGTAIFSAVNSVLLQPLPFPHSDQLVVVWATNPKLNLDFSEQPPSVADFDHWRKNVNSVERFTLMRSYLVNLAGEGEPERLGSARVSVDFFPILGVKPAMGRWFGPEEDQPLSRAVVISDSLWRRRFAADRSLIGEAIQLDGRGYTVVGVMPPGFNFPTKADIPFAYGFSPKTEVWKPLGLGNYADRGNRTCVVLGRLRPGASVENAQAEISVAASQMAALYPDTNVDWGAQVILLKDQIVGRSRAAFVMLLGAAGFVLLIACSGVASMTLTRLLSRNSELAVRVALGATRWDTVRQVITETLILSLGAGAVGFVLCYWMLRVFMATAPDGIPRLAETTIDWWVAAFFLAITVVSGILSGVVPALQVFRTDPNLQLREGSFGSTLGARSNSLRRLLAAVEVAFSVVLLIGAGLLIRSFQILTRHDPGFQADSLLTLDLLPPLYRYPTPEIQLRLFEETLQRIRNIPGVKAAGAVNDLPLSGSENFTRLVAEGHPVEVGDEAIADQRSCSPDYFRAIGTPLLRGRYFNQGDDSGHPDVVIVNQTLVDRVFGDEDPTGKRIRMGSAKDVNRPWLTIVGVVADIKHTSLEGIVRPQAYRCYLQEPWMKVSFVVRGNKESRDLSSSVRRVIHDMDSQLPVGNLQPMAGLVSSALAPRRFSSQLLGALAAIALVLAMIGTYGVLSSSVQQRRREIGIRMALGAMRSDVMRIIIMEGVSTVAIGLCIGLAGAFVFTRVLSSMLYDVAPTDPFTYFSVVSLFLVAALIAAYMPARRAGRVSPMEVLRSE